MDGRHGQEFLGQRDDAAMAAESPQEGLSGDESGRPHHGLSHRVRLSNPASRGPTGAQVHEDSDDQDHGYRLGPHGRAVVDAGQGQGAHGREGQGDTFSTQTRVRFCGNGTSYATR